jgi:hypothetical protein
MDIPNEYLEFCREVGKVARKYKLSEFRGQFRPPIMTHDGHSEISFSWTQGRHGVESGNISVQSQIWVNTKIDEGGLT